jgi:O-acetyl-ADP-ribose deacetylase (regulator of RNase III)
MPKKSSAKSQKSQHARAAIGTNGSCSYFIRAFLASRYGPGNAPGPKCYIVLAQADITTLHIEAIVNAANPQLGRGSGVCGSIFGAAGPRLDVTCAALGGCATGEAVLTEPFGIGHIKAIVHAVGPHVTGSLTDLHRQQLADCYERSLDVASQHGLTSIVCVSLFTVNS